MKVTYTFKEPEERAERELFEKASSMYSSLFDIDSYLREIRKGWIDDNIDQIQEKIQNIIMDSGIHEIN